MELFEGVPSDLVALVTDQPERGETLNIDGPDGHTIETAGGIFFYDGARWRISPGVLAYVNPRQEWTGEEWVEIELDADGAVGEALFQSGFTTCLSDYCFGDDLTVETIMEAEYGHVLGSEQRRGIRARVAGILDRHPRIS